MNIVCCPSCGDLRKVGNVAFWHIWSPKGAGSGNCKSCSLLGNSYSKGFSPQASIAQKRAVLGNKWAVGTVFSPEELQRRSDVMKGNTYNPGLRGEASPNWKGGRGTERHRAMSRSEYKQWRSAVFQRDNFTCQICDQYSGYLHADHIKTWAENPELRYDINNGRTVCRACHYYITFKRKIPSTSQWGLTSREK